MYNTTDIERICGVEVAISPEQRKAMKNWENMYKTKHNRPEGERSLNLPAAISSEIARLVSLEMRSVLTGSERAERLNEFYQKFIRKLRREIEYAAAYGGMIFKPYISDGEIAVDCVNANEFYPIAFDSNDRICSAVFKTVKTVGRKYYTKLELHDYSYGQEKIKNFVFVSSNKFDIGKRINQKNVAEWSKLPDEAVITNIDRPLFTYFKMPFANTVDKNSPLGISVFEKACDLICDADEQYNRLLWEFKSAERALYVDGLAIKRNNEGKYELPRNQDKLYRVIDTGKEDFFKDFSPTIRQAELRAGLDEILRKIEFNCSLAYGTLSNVQNADKTAEEIRSSKQRSYAVVCDIQTALGKCLSDVAYSMNVWCTLAGLAPKGEYYITTEWNDSILADRAKEYQERMSLLTSNIIQPWEMRAWYFGEDEETAKKMCPSPEEIYEE